MVKKNEFKKRSRYLAMLTALSLAFSNIGSCVNMVYAAEAEAEVEVEEAGGSEDQGEEQEENGGDSEEEAEDGGEDAPEENGGSEEEDQEKDPENGSENDFDESDPGEENGGDDNSEDENSGEENSGEDSKEEKDAEEENDSEDGEDPGESENGENAGEDSGENSIEENETEKNEEGEQSGAGAENGAESSNGAVKEDLEAQKNSYKLTYSVDPDEGAKVDGPESVAAGKSAVFTVEAQDGYVIKNVSCEGAEISTVEDVETASASNAQKESTGKNDGEKFQTYQIENVEADAEIIIEMDNAPYGVALMKNLVAAGTVVKAEMSQDEIDAAVEAAKSENKVLEVEAGDYSIDNNSHKKVIIDASGMTVLLKGGDYTRAQIITREDATVVLEDDVTFEGEAKETHNTAAAVFVEQGTLTLDTNGSTMTVSDYTNGLRVGYANSDSRGTGDAEFYLSGDGIFDIEGSVLTPEDSSYVSDDDFPKDSGVKGCGIALMASENYQRLLTVDGATLKSIGNSKYGVYRHNIDENKKYFNEKMKAVVFTNGAKVYIENNGTPDDRTTGYYDEAYSEEGNILEVTDGAELCIRNNGWNGYGYAYPKNIGRSTAQGRKYLFKDSTIHMDDNYNTNASFASSKTVIDNSIFTANNQDKDKEHPNESSGIYRAGGLQIINGSDVTAKGNSYAGIYARYDSKIVNSRVIADNNGFKQDFSYPYYGAGIYIECGELTIEDSIVEAKENPYSILIAGSSPQSNIRYFGNNVVTLQGEYYDTAAVNGPVVNGFDNSAVGTYFGRNYVLSGSVQGDTANMRYGNDEKGMQFAELNPVIGGNDIVGGDYTNNYAAPINTSHTALTRFDLHQSANKEAASDVNEFVYHDPNTGEKYAYSFRYNTADEDLNGTGGNAYVWAPVSVLHYDATEGKINGFGTAVQGNMALVNTRGDGSAVGNSGDQGETSDRYATDYTIFGNSMNLTEGELPVAVRDGYKFAGWYVADNESAAVDYARSGNWAELNKLLNTRFTADSKVSEDITDVSKGQEEKTIYAKWVLPNQYNIVINYIDERTGEHITASYSSDYMEEGSNYDVDALLNKVIDGYTWIRYEGGQPAGSLNGDLVFNVYYNRNSTSNRGGGSGGSGGGSSSGGHGSIITSNGGPGVTIQDENVPLAELPEEILPEEAVSIPEEDVPLAALPKTGQSAGKEIALLVSAMVLGAAGIFRKKTKED